MDNIKCQEKINEEVLNIKEYQEAEKERYFEETKEQIRSFIKNCIKENPHKNEITLRNMSADFFWPRYSNLYKHIQRNFKRLVDELEDEGISLCVVNKYKTIQKGIIFKREVKEFIGEVYKLSW